MKTNSKIDILYYMILIISIILFVYTYAILEPIELLGQVEDYDLMGEEAGLPEIVENGLENKERIQEVYNGDIYLEKKWIYFTLLFTNYREEFIEEYEKYTFAEDSVEKTEYEKEISERYGIDTQEERDKLYNTFNEIYVRNNINTLEEKKQAFNRSNVIIKIEVVVDSIINSEEGINFDIKATQIDNTELLFNCTIFNKYISEEEFLKLLPKEEIIETEDIITESSEGE